MYSIALIMPYFGDWPIWSDLFFQSCRYNNSIDFLFYTDNEPPQSAIGAKNIIFNKITFKEYCNRVSAFLDIDFHPTRVYKLCDLRPFYGFIHQQEIKEYDFWGYGDVDLVWGDIRKFYSDDLLQKYDIFSTHTDRLSGHLAIIRNKPEYTEMAFRYRHWREMLCDNRNHIFDEQGFTLLFHPAARILWRIHKWVFHKFRFRNDWVAYNRFCEKYNQFFGLKRRRVYFKEQNTTPWDNKKQWLYSNGCMYDLQTNDEIIYLHFLLMKKKWTGDYFHPSIDGTIISFDGIHPIQ